MALTLLVSNNANSVLAASINATSTTLSVNTGAGSLFPAVVAGQSFFKLTIVDAATGQLNEIVHVTARNGDVFTILRGQEGTVARAWSANDLVANMLTAGTIRYLVDGITNLPVASLTQAGITQLSSATDSDAENVAATPKAVKDALANAVNIDVIYPIGIVTWFAQNKDPNTLFPGTTWKYIGENRTVRLASADGSDVMTTGGTDSIKLTADNLPAHAHEFSANTSSFDYNTKTTSTFDYGTKSGGTNIAGGHFHSLLSDTTADTAGSPVGLNLSDARLGVAGATHGSRGYINNLYSNGPQIISNSGDHAHTFSVGIGAHSHTMDIGAHSHSVSGTTNNTGSGKGIDVTNSYIKLMGWYRSA